MFYIKFKFGFKKYFKQKFYNKNVFKLRDLFYFFKVFYNLIDKVLLQ